SATHWKIERMTATDRTILRLGAYELLYSPTPARVAVNEAVELAKRYGTAQSAAFVNGILDALLQTRAKEKDEREQAARRRS
ncbi:MAG: transcription antitermination factor NusB, partial [Planctomycetia bacterium]|nr:transcription antitermination factor NusB [Planctomycetia bacterium]